MIVAMPAPHRLLLLLVPCLLGAEDDPFSLTDTVVRTDGVAVYVPAAEAQRLRPLAERLISGWHRLDRRSAVPATGRMTLQISDRDDSATALLDASFGRLGMVGMAADQWGPGGPNQVEARARRILLRADAVSGSIRLTLPPRVAA